MKMWFSIDRASRAASSLLIAASLSNLAPVALVSVPLLACGGSQDEELIGSPMDTEDYEYFDGAIDFVADPEALQGQWREQWSNGLDQRVRRADAIAYVTVQTYRTDIDPNGGETKRFSITVDRNLSGEVEEGMTFTSRPGEIGYNTVDGREDQILNSRFVLFLRWHLPEGGTVATPYWHLSPAVEAVTARTEYLIERRRGEDMSDGTRVIVHEHTND